jgi:hypothetical protein
MSIYTPNIDDYDSVTMNGFNIMREKRIVICGLMRDSENIIPLLKRRVDKIGAFFRDYKVLIVENDSKDDTRKLLLEWSNENNNIIILGCGINQHVCKLNLPKTEGHDVYYKRIDKMAMLRQIYLDYVISNLSAYDYMAVWDMDIIGSIYIDGIANSIGYMNSPLQAEAVCAYGIYDWSFFTLYYDTYAHQDVGDNFDPERKHLHDIKKGLQVRYTYGDKPVKVRSCFSGFTLYSIRSIIKYDAKYDRPDENNLQCEHVLFNKYFSNVYMNPNMINLLIMNP